MEVEKVLVVAKPAIKGSNDVCYICHMSCFESCIKCQSDMKGTSCYPIIGECRHTYHQHCLYRWLDKNDKCPMCNQVWRNELPA